MRRVGDLFFGYFDIFDRKNIHHYYYFSVIAEIITHLRDITTKIGKLGEKINIDVSEMGCRSITKLITFFRDALCHNESNNRRNSKGFIFSHNVYAAYDFPDEITILTGDFRIYVRRHLFLTYIQAIQIFSSYKEFQTNEDFSAVLLTVKHFDVLKNPLLFRNSDPFFEE